MSKKHLTEQEVRTRFIVCPLSPLAEQKRITAKVEELMQDMTIKN